MVSMWITCSSITLGKGFAKYVFRFLGPSSDQLDEGLWAGPGNLYFNCLDVLFSSILHQGPDLPGLDLIMFHIINSFLMDPALLWCYYLESDHTSKDISSVKSTLRAQGRINGSYLHSHCILALIKLLELLIHVPVSLRACPLQKDEPLRAEAGPNLPVSLWPDTRGDLMRICSPNGCLAPWKMPVRENPLCTLLGGPGFPLCFILFIGAFLVAK